MAGPAEFVVGKIFIGLLLNVLLFGINVTQTYFYYIHSKKDRLSTKIWVVVVFIADFIQPLFCSIYLYRTLIVHFGNEAILSEANNLFAIATTMTGMTSTMVQVFFALRIRILTNNWYYVTFVIAAAVSSGACSIVAAYVGKFNPHFVDFRNFKNFKIVVIVGLSSEMVADAMITSILLLFLHKHKSAFRRSDKMADRIIRVIIQTGLLTLIFAGLDMLLYLLSSNGTYILLNIVTSKLYSSSFLSSLNSRQGWGYDVSTGDQVNLSSLKFSSNLPNVDRTCSMQVPTQAEDPNIELGLQERHEVKEIYVAKLDCGVSTTDGSAST